MPATKKSNTLIESKTSYKKIKKPFENPMTCCKNIKLSFKTNATFKKAFKFQWKTAQKTAPFLQNACNQKTNTLIE